MYALADVLILHPTDMDEDTSEDLQYPKAYPIFGAPKSSMGRNFQTIDVEWKIFPDQTQVLASPPVLIAGYKGEIPS
jgi:hypothetical protein